jgi:hypothetical protein
MTHLKPVNRKAIRVEKATLREPQGRPEQGRGATDNDVVALQRTGIPQNPHFPLGCSLVFSPGWEADRTGGTAGLCQPVERDLFDCHIGCYWPAQVPDQLNHAPDWTARCAAAQKDWRKLDLIFP